MTDAGTGTYAAEKTTSPESIMVGGDLTERQTAILEYVRRTNRGKDCTAIERGDTHVLLQDADGKHVVLLTAPSAEDAEAQLVYDLVRRFENESVSVLVPDENISGGVIVEVMKELCRLADTWYLVSGGGHILGQFKLDCLVSPAARMYPLRVPSATLALEDGTWEEDRFLARLSPFRPIWARVFRSRTRVTSGTGHSKLVGFEDAAARSGSDPETLLRAAFLDGIRTEAKLRSWLRDALEQDLVALCTESEVAA